jgi:hypothetical protein
MLIIEVDGYWQVKSPRNSGGAEARAYLTQPEHTVEIIPIGRGWSFDGRLESPTITPSILETWKRPAWTDDDGAEQPERQCVNHFNISAGKIVYHGDCTHSCAGQTLELLPWTEAEIASRRQP